MEQYPQVDLTAWEQVGEGCHSVIYSSDAEPGVLLKIKTVDSDEKDIAKHFYTSKAVFELGIPTPEMYEVVMSGENYGYKCQAIAGKKSIARLCADDTSSIDANATLMAQLIKEFHAKTVKNNEWIPSKKELMLQAVKNTNLVSGKAKERLMELVENTPESNHLLHGDLQMGNLIVADEKPYWIDLGQACHGVPLFDLGHFYLFCNVFGRSIRIQHIAHMSHKELMQFWNTFALAYNGPDHLDAFTGDCRHYAALDIIFLGMSQKLSFTERVILGTLAKRLLK